MNFKVEVSRETFQGVELKPGNGHVIIDGRPDEYMDLYDHLIRLVPEDHRAGDLGQLLAVLRRAHR